MDTTDATTADLSPLEQRRERLRAITAADRMLVQIYTKVSRALTVMPAIRATHTWSARRSAAPTSRAASPPKPQPAPQETVPWQPEAHEDDPNVPFVYRYDDEEDEIDAPEDDTAEPLSPNARAALDIEKQANDIFQEYLKGCAELSGTSDPPDTGPPPGFPSISKI